MMLKKCLKEFAPDTSQGRLFLKVAGVLVAFAAGCHSIMGASYCIGADVRRNKHLEPSVYCPICAS